LRQFFLFLKNGEILKIDIRSYKLFFIFIVLGVTLFSGNVKARADELEDYKIKIGVAWQGSADMQDRLSAGLLNKLKAEAPQIEIEWQKELKDMEALDVVVKRFEKEKDGMVILRSNGAVYLRDNPPSIPAFIGGCNDPFMLGVVGGINSSQGMITGVTYALSYNSIFLTFKRLFPKMSSLLLIYEEGHPGALVDRAGTKKAAQGYGIRYNEVGISNMQERLDAVNEWKDKVTAIVLANNSLVFDNTGPVVEAAGETPVLAYSDAAVKDGALCGFSANDEKLGEILAESIIDVFLNGKEIKDIPIKYDESPEVYLNLRTADKYRLLVPPSVLKISIIVDGGNISAQE